MKLTQVAVLLMVSLVGCGQVQDDSVYDTAGNPDGFPALAIDLLNDLESGQLAGGEAISNGFGQLYTEHSELLDHEAWGAVIVRLGGRFRQAADSLRELGIGAYTSAAEYYQLASFARPEDTVLRRQAAIFGCWLGAGQSPLVDLTPLTGADLPALEEVVSVTKYFLLGDTLYREFFETELFPILDRVVKQSDLLNAQAFDQLAPPDRALVIFAGLKSAADIGILTSFAEPRIDLAAARISRIDANNCAVELYFIPREAINEPLKVHLRLESTERETNTWELTPHNSTTGWLPDQIAAVTRTIRYSKPMAMVAVGLADFGRPRPRFLQSEDSRGVLYLLGPDNLVLD